ncbi:MULTISPECIES: subclass B3 metallo-beta-lactamase [unclassified Mucilaginibacter]|uniref:subclass B3 metallo-beta-lactamase n=1 Tax=unclassified Mucilaginibacter TaxID=2617802 RepID=UPI0031F6E1DA
MSIKRKIWIGIKVIITVGAIWLYIRWKDASNYGGQRYKEPFRIAGNLYYVGTRDVTSYLLAGPKGHVLIDGGYPGTAPMIIKSITQLGFKITDVKILLNSHAHVDHAGGLAQLQKASGAQLWVSENDADIIESGGASYRNPGPLNLLMHLGIIGYPAARVNHRFKDGAQIRLGPIELTAHVTGGHTPGATTWAIPVQEGNRKLLAVDMCDLQLPMPQSIFNWNYDTQIQKEFERGFKTLRSLPTDIYLANHARTYSQKRKLAERSIAKDPIAPFIDRQGYLDDINKAEKKFIQTIKEQKQSD